MVVVDDVDELIERFHQAQGEFVKGNPDPSLARGSSPIEMT